jgi:hypothetical protein
MPPEVEQQLMMADGVCCDVLLGAGSVQLTMAVGIFWVAGAGGLPFASCCLALRGLQLGDRMKSATVGYRMKLALLFRFLGGGSSRLDDGGRRALWPPAWCRLGLRLGALEAAVYGGSRVSDAQLVSATAFAAVDGENCAKLLKEKGRGSVQGGGS